MSKESKRETERNTQQSPFVELLMKQQNRRVKRTRTKKVRPQKKKSERTREQTATGQQIQVIIGKVMSSQLMSDLMNLDFEGRLSLQTYQPVKIMNAYDSMKYNMYQDLRPCKREWFDEVNWNSLISEIQDFIDEYMTEEVNKVLTEYKDNVMKFHLSHFVPKLLLESMLQYGINDGLWDNDYVRKFREVCYEWVEDFQWTNEDPQQLVNNKDLFPTSVVGYTPNQIQEIWHDMIKIYEPIKVLSNKSTSAHPDFERQGLAYHLEHAVQAVIVGPSEYIVIYHRRHGQKQKEEDGVLIYVIKVRAVFGVDYPSKVYGTPLTWSFKQTKPERSAYYRKWFDLFLLVLEKFLDATYSFTADQSMHDAKQHKTQMLIEKNVIMESMPTWMTKYYEKLFNATYDDPKLIVALKSFVQLGRMISASGSPPTPLQESMSTDGYLTLSLEDQDVGIDFKIIQIDDSMVTTDKKVNKKKMSLHARKHGGAIINPDKTEDSDSGFLTFLQIMFGYIFKENKMDDLQFLVDLKKAPGIGILGHIWRRIHRMMYSERQGAKISPFSGDVIFFNEDTNEEAPVVVQRILGLIGSFGPWVPIGLLEIIISHFEKTKVWKEEVLPFLSKAPASRTGDWGFDGNHIIKYLRRKYVYE
jgi:hypothetical protein